MVAQLKHIAQESDSRISLLVVIAVGFSKFIYLEARFIIRIMKEKVNRDYVIAKEANPRVDIMKLWHDNGYQSPWLYAIINGDIPCGVFLYI